MEERKMKSSVFCSLEVDALHCWPTCPEDHPCSFLRAPHRHLFKIKCWLAEQASRETEFIDFKHRVLQWIKSRWPDRSGSLDLGACSCEDLAKALLTEFGLEKCEVTEDGENGAEVTA